MSCPRNKKRLRPDSPSASACVGGELIQGRRNMKKYFSCKCCQKVEMLQGNHRFKPGWGENVKKRSRSDCDHDLINPKNRSGSPVDPDPAHAPIRRKVDDSQKSKSGKQIDSKDEKVKEKEMSSPAKASVSDEIIVGPKCQPRRGRGRPPGSKDKKPST